MESDEKAITEVDEVVLRDLSSRFADVACPVHNVPPRFEVDEKGSVVEHMCCEVLLRIVRELEAQEEQEGSAPGAEGA